ncbi:signal peptidase I [Candidatus Pacearchaeota archaeon]|nr:signal peptidase I [Candidatus Pacearchaeota archaeon]
MSELKELWKKFWFLLWKDNSWKGWIFSIIFLFIFIKFIFFPLLSLTTGTQLPLAIVESCSMYHDGNILGNYDAWWNRHETKYSNLNISKDQFKDFIFKKGFNKGDILFIVGTKPENIKIGDVIIFNGGTRNPIIHRVVEIKQENGGYYFSTIGDNNNGQLTVEKDVAQTKIVGKAVFKLAPYIGWGKLIFFEPSKPSSERGFCNEN